MTLELTNVSHSTDIRKVLYEVYVRTDMGGQMLLFM